MSVRGRGKPLGAQELEGQTALPLGEDTAIPQSNIPFEVAFLALANVKGLGTKGLRALVKHSGDNVGMAWEVDLTKIADILQSSRVPAAVRVAEEIQTDRVANLAAGEKAIEQLSQRGISLLGPSRIPRTRAEIPDGPGWLFVEGNAEVLQEGPHVAVIGTRTPSAEGIKATEIAIRTMAAYPLVLVSGLANGIDAAAHGFALRDRVQNVAFLGHGVNFTFPTETADIRKRIVATGGAVVTEYLPDETYRKQNFVQRNRLQAGLADVVIPVEGAADGGSAHTVRFAARYGRNQLGFLWPNSGDLVGLVSQQNNARVLRIFSDEDRRILDHIFRDLADSSGSDTYALELVERLLDRESRVRTVRSGDVARLQSRLAELVGDDHDA